MINIKIKTVHICSSKDFITDYSCFCCLHLFLQQNTACHTKSHISKIWFWHLPSNFVKVGYFSLHDCFWAVRTVASRKVCILFFLSTARKQCFLFFSAIFHKAFFFSSLLSFFFPLTQQFKFTTNSMLLFPWVSSGCSLLAAGTCTNLRVSHEDE